MAKKSEYKQVENIFSSISSLESSELDIIQEFIQFLKQRQKTHIIPCGIFEKNPSTFESIVRFLREQKKLSYKAIAKLLKRKIGTIGVVYLNAKRKSKISYKKIKPKLTFRANIFSKNLTVLESVVIELKDNLNLSIKEIAELIKRNYRTVWTVYRRGKTKLKNGAK